MNWDDGRLFLAVARAGQLLGAARSLGLTQATLSRRMKALEEGLGTTLLVRRPHGCALTPAGEALAATLERVEAEFDGASDRIGGEDRRLSGVVRIGAPDGLGVSFIAPRLGLFADRHPGLAVVDRGYRGHRVESTQVLISGSRRGLTPILAKALRRRSSIEPEIGHMKTDGRLSRCFLKGTIGDAIFAVLCGCGHNIRKILAHLRALLATIISVVLAILRQTQGRQFRHAAA